MSEGGYQFFASWVMKENTEDSWFVRWGRGGCRLKDGGGKGKPGRLRREINDGQGPDAGGASDGTHGDWGSMGTRWQRHCVGVGAFPWAGFTGAFRISGKGGCSSVGEESLREQRGLQVSGGGCTGESTRGDVKGSR